MAEIIDLQKYREAKQARERNRFFNGFMEERRSAEAQKLAEWVDKQIMDEYNRPVCDHINDYSI